MNPCKVAIIGDSTVGKTSLAVRCCHNDFRNVDSTVGASFCVYTCKLENRPKPNEIKLHLWDTAGQERFRSIVPMYLRDANAIIIAYDITANESFEHVIDHWIPLIKEQLPSQKIEPRIYISVNKWDLVKTANDDKIVSHYDRIIQNHKKRIKKIEGFENAKFYKTSSYTGLNVRAMFYDIADNCYESLRKNSYRNFPDIVELDSDSSTPKSSSLLPFNVSNYC